MKFRGAGLDGLPNALLFAIAELLLTERPLRHRYSHHFRALYAFSRVNRRIQRVTEPLLTQDLHYDTMDEATWARLLLDMGGHKGDMVKWVCLASWHNEF